MDAKRSSEPTLMKNRTTVERKSERELVVTRTFNSPARLVFEAWTKPELLKQWWAPKSFGVSFISCEADARTGGSYRFRVRPSCLGAANGVLRSVTPASSGQTMKAAKARRGDPGRDARPLSLEGSSRRCHRLRKYE